MTAAFDLDGSEIEVLIHKPGSPHIERLIPEEDGPATFKLHPWERAVKQQEMTVVGRLEIQEELVRDARPTVKTSVSQLNGTKRSAHIASIEAAQAAMAEGPLRKVVLSSLLHVKAVGLDHADIVRRLALAHPDSFTWVCTHPSIGTWFGSSPEPLVQGTWPHLRTACLAGTRMAHLGDVTDPWTEKEREEQSLVTEGALAALQQSGCQNIQTSDRETIQYGPIEHLRTWIDFEATRPLDEIINALHPTPAVGGTPRKEALDFIAQHEDHDRAYYTGWVGVQENQDLSFYVNLRCAQLHDDVLTAYAGGGITAASRPSAEWDETRHKLRAVLDPIVHWNE